MLFALGSIAESVDIEELIYLPTLFQQLNQIPCNNYKVVTQALYLIGEFVDVVKVHLAASTFLSSTFNLLYPL